MPYVLGIDIGSTTTAALSSDSGATPGIRPNPSDWARSSTPRRPYC